MNIEAEQSSEMSASSIVFEIFVIIWRAFFTTDGFDWPTWDHLDGHGRYG